MDVRAVALGLTFAVMWSSAFASARIILLDAPPLWSLALRFLISGGLAVGLARALGQSWRLPGQQARAVVIFGLCQNALYLGLFFVAMQRIEASLASIIASSMPLVVAALGWALRGERLAPLGIAGMIAGFVGVALIMGSRIQAGADPAAVMLCVVGATALAVATLTVRGASAGGNLLMVVGLQMLVGSAALTLVALVAEPLRVTPTLRLAAAFAYQIAVPGLAATLIWFYLVGRIGAIKASAFHFLNPFFGVLIAAVLLGEAISGLDMLGVAVATLGILAVQLAKLRSAPQSNQDETSSADPS
ncbi:DMT family transporter [Tabrizicola oligotrophica]|uniref:DMT family transporter n=1 Tax=Tabrizicola oligotrophica TaxID=2710650 RepID=A0A6M0QS59_9RHOB|nr:DMT family transporter [Tabrizicola oligotrophica]NEY90275.1 DMT family transporter [Tabrizicola oligotrophica]